MKTERQPYVGCTYIGSKPIFRQMMSSKDYSPLCFHYHETELEAIECPQAKENFVLNTPASLPKEDSKSRTRKRAG